MQFEVLATCHTTRARVCRMNLARRSGMGSSRIQLNRFKCHRWSDPTTYIHAGGYSGGHQGSDRAADGVTWSHTDPQQYISP